MKTPRTEVENGQEVVIADCRVKDTIVFKVPDDLPEGIYGVTVRVPNNTVDPEISGRSEFVSNPQFIRVVPPDTATFQITTEELFAKKETSPAFFGSDEVGIRICVIPIGSDLNPGQLVEHKFPSADNPIFGDVDDEERRRMDRVLFRESNVGGVSLAIIGFEVDDRDIFEKQIQEFQDAYSEILQSNWNAIASSLGGLGSGLAIALGASAAWATAIAAAVVLAINAFVALWAPADLIIEDAAAFSALDLSSLSSINFPPPPVVEYTSAGGIDVKVEPVTKGAEYIERRVYRSDAEDSDYRITLRYSRSQ
jgi:hypothetical protein